MISILTDDRELLRAADELLRDLPRAAEIEARLTAVPGGEGLTLSVRGNEGVLTYSEKRAFFRGVGLFVQHAGETVTLSEKPRFDTVGMMADVSRNAVMRLESVKRLARLSALEGFNAMMLYTEDTYEMKEYPYFGHLRGRYTAEELREMDDYCHRFGIELIPCIQTLAHLNAIFEWPAFKSYNDCNDILLAESEKTYELVECMLRTVKGCLRSRRINLGLDEAHMLGSGAYLDQHGYSRRCDIMLRHLQKVTELCRAYGYEPRMWSDMFFRTVNKGVYRVKGTVIPKEIAESVPPELTLVYWDYRQPKKESYDEMFRQHEAFSNPIAFAGGDCSWYGIVPLSHLALTASHSALSSAMEHGVKEVYCTMWKDDGAACSFFSALPILFSYGEHCWTGSAEPEQLRARMQGTVGLSFDDFYAMEEINDLPGRTHLGEVEVNPNKYTFYENILTGKFSAHIPDGSAVHFAKMAVRMGEAAERAGAYGYLFETLASLCDALSVKAELSKELYRAYQGNDRESLRKIKEQRIPTVRGMVEDFRVTFRRQWMKESKNFGFDVMDIRIGGVLAQLETAEFLLGEYLSGRIERIDELEEERLPYSYNGMVAEDGDLRLINRWERMGAQVISNMF